MSHNKIHFSIAERSQVCGLSWSEELQLLASGGNEGDVWRPGACVIFHGYLMVIIWLIR